MGPATRRTAVGIIATLTVVAVLGAPAAGGRSSVGGAAHARGGTLAHISCDNPPCDENGQIAVPGPGTGAQELPLPAATEEAQVTVQPQSTHALGPFFGLAFSLAMLPSKSARLLYCATVYSGFVHAKEVAEFTEHDPSLAVLFLGACLEIAFRFLPPPSSRPSGALDAAASCRDLNTTAAVTVSGGPGHYTIVVGGQKPAVRRHAPVAVSCRRHGSGFVLMLKSATRHRSLAQLLGPTIGIGFSNPSSKSVGVKLNYKLT